MADEDRTQTVGKLIEAGRDREAAQRGALVDDDRTETHPHKHGATMQPLTQFAQLAGPLSAVMSRIAPDQLDRPTPCTEFTVRGVLEHMIDGATTYAAAFRGEASPEPKPELGDVLAGIGPALGDLGDALNTPGALDRTIAAPFGQVPGDTFARFVVLDGLVHGWDLAIATDQAYDLPDELVAAADTFARQVLDPLRDGQTFAEAVDPPAEASPIEQLAAYTGRRPLHSN